MGRKIPSLKTTGEGRGSGVLMLAPQTDILAEYDNLYLNVGDTINEILVAFSKNDKKLEDLSKTIDFAKYSELSDKFFLSSRINERVFKGFKELLIKSIEAMKHSDNRMSEQQYAYTKLLDMYEKAINPSTSASILEAGASLTTPGTIKPEILEYVRRGGKLVNEFGNLIPLDLTVLGEIRKELQL